MAVSRTAQRAAKSQRRRWRPPWLAILAAALIWGGMLVFIYPSVASWISQYNQSLVVRGYADAVSSADPDRIQQLANAHAYNDALSSGAILEAGGNVPLGAGEISSGFAPDVVPYPKQLVAGPSGLMGRLKIRSIDLDLPFYHGTSPTTLLQGLGHLEGTSLPVGGIGTRAVITGHRGLATATMFTNLDQVKLGDTLVLEVFGEVLTYSVVDKQIVEPEETEAIRAEPDRDLLTLITCTPLGINTHRILVTGERILPTPARDLADAGADPTVPHFPWWAVVIGVSTILVGVYVWKSGYRPEREPRGDN